MITAGRIRNARLCFINTPISVGRPAKSAPGTLFSGLRALVRGLDEKLSKRFRERGFLRMHPVKARWCHRGDHAARRDETWTD